MDVWQKLEANAYANKDPLPVRPRKPRLLPTASSAEVRRHADALDQYDQNLREYREHLVTHNSKTLQLETEFKHDLEVYYNLVGHVKADLLYQKAWWRGHAHGLSEVAEVYSDLVELILT